MSDPAPLLPVTTVDGSHVQIHVDRIVKIMPAGPAPAAGSGAEPESGSTLTLATATGTISFGVKEYLLHRGPPELAGLLLLTNIHGIPIKIHPLYVILVGPLQPGGTMLEIYGATGTEVIHVQQSFDDVTGWWALVASARLTDPGVHFQT